MRSEKEIREKEAELEKRMDNPYEDHSKKTEAMIARRWLRWVLEDSEK